MGVAQLAEHRTVAPTVAGSIPVSHPKFKIAWFVNCVALASVGDTFTKKILLQIPLYGHGHLYAVWTAGANHDPGQGPGAQA